MSRARAVLQITFFSVFCLSGGAQAQSQQPKQPQPFGAIPKMSPLQQEHFPPKLLEELAAIKAAALADDYAFRQVAHLTENIGPRLSGSPQASAAVDYVADQLRQLGLEVRLEEVRVPHWIRGAETAELTEYPGQVAGTTQKVVLTALGGSISTPANGINADVVVVNDFDELKAMGRQNVAGKIVLFNARFDKQKAAAGLSFVAYGEAVRYRAAGAKAAAELGAVASLIRSVGSADFRLPHTGFSYPGCIPAGAVTAEDGDLIAHLAAQGKVRMHLTITPQTLPDATSHNVIADLKGSEHPEQVVVVSGHLDSWDLGTGAIDDAAGVAVAMETAEILHKLHLRPKRTLRVIAWMNEENGLAGGRTYGTDHKADAANHMGMIEADSGTGHPIGIDAAVEPGALPALQPIADLLAESGAGILQRGEDTGADIGPMFRQGVPSFEPMVDQRTYFRYQHTAADTVDKIQPKHLAEISAVVGVLAYSLAEMPQPLPRKAPDAPATQP